MSCQMRNGREGKAVWETEFSHAENTVDHESAKPDKSFKNKENIEIDLPRIVPVYVHCLRIIVNSVSLPLNMPICII